MTISEDKLIDTEVFFVDRTGIAKCLGCSEYLKKPSWQRIETKDLYVLELDCTVFNLEILQKCSHCGHLNVMVYADNLLNECLMAVEEMR